MEQSHSTRSGGGKGETPSRELNRGGCHGESPHNKHGEELPSQHLKASEHPAPGLFTAGWRWGPGERGYVHCNSGPTGGWIDRLCRRPNSRQGSEFSQREIVLVWALPHSPPPLPWVPLPWYGWCMKWCLLRPLFVMKRNRIVEPYLMNGRLGRPV